MDALVAAAKKEGSVLLYTTTAADKIASWIQPFEDKYGISVKYYRAASNALFSKFSQEETAGKHLADLVGLSVPTEINDAISKGWTQKYIPQGANAFPPEFVVQNTAYPLYLIAHGFGWNTTEVTPDQAKALTDDGYQALLDPSLKGKIALVGPVGGGQEAAYWDIVNNPNLGWDYLQKLAAQNPVIISSAITMTTGLTSGEYAVGFPSSDTSIWPAVQKGAPLEFAYSNPSVTSEEQVFISSQAPHPNAAKLFLEWTTSLEGQTELGDASSGVMARTDWVDNREITKQPWYKAPVKLDNSWATDPKFIAGIDDVVKQWNKVFGQS